MEYYVIRRKSDQQFYGKNYHFHSTGNTKPRHGFGFPPYLFTSLRWISNAMVTNYVIIAAKDDVEILKWSTEDMKMVENTEENEDEV